MEDHVDAAALAWLSAIEDNCARVVPGGWSMRAAEGRLLVVTGSPVAELNGVLDATAEPDPEAVATLAGLAAERVEVPWSIGIRARPTPAIEEIAARHHLTARTRHPFMVPRLTADDAAAPHDGLPVVRAVSGDEAESYTTALAEGFEAPAEALAVIGSAPVLDAPGSTGLVIEHEGRAVATGMAIVTGDHVGVFNISTVPEHRKRGYGSAITRAALRIGFQAGARSAFLQATDAGLSVYESLGFRTVEHWTLFTSA